MTTTWWAGFSAMDITPSRPLDLAGFAAREQPSLGIHDRLSVRVVVVGDGAKAAAIASVDLIGVDADSTHRVRARVRRALGHDLEYLAVVATHTHGGPAVLRRALLGDVDDAYLAEVEERIARTVVRAFEDRRPAVVRYGLGHDGTVAKNRRDPHGPIDPDLPVVRLEDAETGRPIALVCSYACHPVTLGPGNRTFTRDYPGYVVDGLSAALGGAPVVFLTGCCGQINMGHGAMDSILGIGLEKRTFDEAERLGGVLAGMAAHTAHRVARPGGVPDASPAPPLRAASARVRLPLAPVGRPDAATIAQLEREAARLTAEPDRRGEAVMAEAHWRWARSHDPAVAHVDTEVGVIALGDVVFVFMPGEIFVEFGRELKGLFPHLHLVTVSYANDAIGYLPHSTAFQAGGYEVELAFRHYGFSGPYAVQAGDALVACVAGLVRSIDTGS